MQEIKILEENFEKALRKSPELRRKAMELATKRAHQTVHTSIGGKLNDSHGKIAGWQVIRLGSKGGYGVVKATNTSSGANSPGAITNYLEHGHKIREPKKRGAKGYRPRIHTASVNGRWFYRVVAADVNRITLDAANEVCKGIADIIEGKNV
ncbi:MAG: hypothetical protein J1E60_07095 [Christensenellaceae bacterium]|nr:hypothetical protein [Christensenellaceae bacterium]